MMQPCASAAKSLGGGPILRNGVKATGPLGIPPPRIVIGSPSRQRRGASQEVDMLRENIRVMYQGYGSDTYLDNGTLGGWFDGDTSKLSLGAQFDLDGLKAWPCLRMASKSGL